MGFAGGVSEFSNTLYLYNITIKLYCKLNNCINFFFYLTHNIIGMLKPGFAGPQNRRIGMELHERLKKLRTEQGVSVYRLARLSDVSENYIRTIEKGNNQPSVQILSKLLKPLGITLAEFFRDDESVFCLTSYEKELIQTVRKLDQPKSENLLMLAKALAGD